MPEQKTPEKTSRATLWELLTYARPQRTVLVAALVLTLVATVVALAQPWVTGRVIDAVTSAEPLQGWVVLLILLFVSDAGLSGFQSYLLGRSGEGVVLGIRRSLISRLLRLPVATHDRHRVGDLLSRVGTDTALLGTALTSSLVNVLNGVLFFLGAIVFMAIIDPVLLLVGLACVLVATLATLAISVKIRAASDEAQKSIGRLGAALERVMGPIRTVKISGAEGREEEAISGEAEAAYRAGVRVARLEAFVIPASAVALQVSFVLILAVGAARLASGAISLGDLSAFLLYLFYLASPLIMIFMSITDLQRGMAAFGRAKEILAAPPEPPLTGPMSPSKPRHEDGVPVVRFDSVTFGYEPGSHVLKDVSFEIPEFSRMALVGPSGSGKSTVFALIERFYEADSGTVFLDGVDVRELPLADLRGSIGYVEQDAPVMAGSIRSNLLYANPEATERELEEVLLLTNLHRLVERLSHGLDSEVGDSGVLLSGGERQRIAVARSLLVRPRLLLLDEVTSQLDSRNEIALRETISAASRRCTVMVVAHRLSTVVDADRIMILNDGRASGIGTHKTLVRSDPLYRELVRNQLIGPGTASPYSSPLEKT